MWQALIILLTLVQYSKANRILGCPVVSNRIVCVHFDKQCDTDADCGTGLTCCPAPCGTQCTALVNLEVGVCPAPPAFNSEFCARATFIPGCLKDDDCQNGDKCCPTGECHVPNCVKPITGDRDICPADNNVCATQQVLCNKDLDCIEGEVCCYNPSCGTSCKSEVQEKPGECKKPRPLAPDCIFRLVLNQCDTDADCKEDLKCCPTGDCGSRICDKPKPGVSTPRPGLCPKPPPYDLDFCSRARLSSDCTVDTDCKEPQLCCKGQCDVLKCQNPIHDDHPGCPVDDRICKQRVDTCSGHGDCKYNEVCCFNPSCGYSCKKKVIPAKCDGKGGIECPDIPCPAGPIKNCLGNPCDFNTCPNYPDATCCADYCDCIPRFYNRQGRDVTAMCVDNVGCPPVCAIFCFFGNVLDENGCPTCECKTGCDGNVPALANHPYCPGESCPAGYACKQPGFPFEDQGVCCPENSCPPVCKIFCIFGNVLDQNGCPTCECQTGCDNNATPFDLGGQNCPATSCPDGYVCRQPDSPFDSYGVCCRGLLQCPKRPCGLDCLFGYVVDENGCELCECKLGCPGNVAGIEGYQCKSDDDCPKDSTCNSPKEPFLSQYGVCCSSEPVACLTCCGRPPCCNPCISCDDGSLPIPYLYCSRSNPTCPSDYTCKTNTFAGDAGICCKEENVMLPCPQFLCVPGTPPCTTSPCASSSCPNFPDAQCCENPCACTAFFIDKTIGDLTDEQCGNTDFECPSYACPPDSALPCFAQPCQVETCPNFPNAHCCDNFCSCTAHFFDANGNTISKEECAKEVIKPGSCPVNPNPPDACAAFIPPGSCTSDGACPGNEKCCKYGCYPECLDPVPCGPVCEIACAFGKVTDANNCPICECKTGCANNVPALDNYVCEPGTVECPSGYQCSEQPSFGPRVCCPEG